MVKIRDLAMIFQNWLKTFFYRMSLTRKLKINLSAKSVKAFSQPWLNFLGILWMIVKTKGSIKSLLKSATWGNNFQKLCQYLFYSQSWIQNMKILTDLTVQIYSYKKIIWWITCKRTWKPKTIFKNQNKITLPLV
jgi:hypothetical protein